MSKETLENNIARFNKKVKKHKEKNEINHRVAKIKKKPGRYEGYVPIKDMVKLDRKCVIQEQQFR